VAGIGDPGRGKCSHIEIGQDQRFAKPVAHPARRHGYSRLTRIQPQLRINLPLPITISSPTSRYFLVDDITALFV